jgi:hypothetical protein
MRKLEKSKSWDVILSGLKSQLESLDPDQDGRDLRDKIARLEQAIAIRSSLSASETPKGKMEFGI